MSAQCDDTKFSLAARYGFVTKPCSRKCASKQKAVRTPRLRMVWKLTQSTRLNFFRAAASTTSTQPTSTRNAPVSPNPEEVSRRSTADRILDVIASLTVVSEFESTARQLPHRIAFARDP